MNTLRTRLYVVRKLLIITVAASTCLLLSIPVLYAESTPAELETIRQEMLVLKQQYEDKVASLEDRLHTLENQRKMPIGHETPEDVRHVLAGVEYCGYVRSGFGVNEQGGDMNTFQAPGADAKYRLGNEGETYGEIVFTKHYDTGENGPDMKVQTRLSYDTLNNANYDPNNDNFAVREAFVEMGNFSWAPDVKFWAGERFYRRHDIHINDFFFLDMSGYGGGAYDIALGDFGKLAVAYIGGSNDNYTSEVGRRAKNNLDIRIYDIDVPFGKGTIWLNPVHAEGGTSTTGFDYPDSTNIAGGVLHYRDGLFGRPGFNKISLQYGGGAASNFSSTLIDPTSGKLNDRWQFRATESAAIQLTDNISVMGALIYQQKSDGSANNANNSWISAGVRPIYHFSDYVALAFEAGVDWVDQEAAYSGALYKFTIAPELRFDKTFFGRPVLRLFTTFAAWDEELKGNVGAPNFANDTSGVTAGIQMETWW